MICNFQLRFLVATMGGLLLAGSVRADITFGSGENAFSMSFVTIGSPNNADTTGNPNSAGAVGYTYNISKYEVSEEMVKKANIQGNLGITLDVRGDNKPATNITWNEAARFVNWLNTSQGFAPAYNFLLQPGEDGYSANANALHWTTNDPEYNPNNIDRSKFTNYFLPSVDEWYKAAYFDPNTNAFNDYANGQNTAPAPVASSTLANTAVYGRQAGPADITLAGGLSPFGVMGLNGNASEWMEDSSTTGSKEFRGGSWNTATSFSTLLSSSLRTTTSQGNGFSDIGFRVASYNNFSTAPVPELGSLAVWTSVALCGLVWSRKRLRKQPIVH